EAAAGQSVALGGELLGAQVDDAELWVDGVPVLRFDDGVVGGTWTVPASISAGTTLSLQIRVRGRNGAEALSVPRELVVRPTQAAALAVSLSAAGGATSFFSGQLVPVSVFTTGGAQPLEATVRLGTTVLGTLSPDPASSASFIGQIRMPTVTTRLSDVL